MSHNNKNDIGIVRKGHWPHLVVSTGLFTGYWPWGPGTLAGFVALLIWVGVSHLFSPLWLCVFTILLVACTFFAGVYTDAVMEQYWGPDPRTVVVDEFFGTWIACIAALFCNNNSFDVLSFFTVGETAIYGFIGFLLFRIIDIWKLFGCRWLDQNVHGGIGCMLDDALAGFYAVVITLCIRFSDILSLLPDVIVRKI